MHTGAGRAAWPTGPKGREAVMAQYRIRPYKDGDYKAVRDIFAEGIMEQSSAAFMHLLTSPWTALLLPSLFFLVLVASGSILLALLPVAIVLAVAWVYVRSFSTDYVQLALRTDLRDIRGTYLGAADSCLWVAEADGAVVGLVAAVQPQDPAERGTALELKRMSVRQASRGQGIARALSRTVLQFAQERGYRAVVLSTSVVQRAAQQLYEHLGFQRVATKSPSLLTRLLHLYIIHYHYDIPAVPQPRWVCPSTSCPRGREIVMAQYRIRPYEDGDYEAVRTIFADGIHEVAPAMWSELLKSLKTHLFLLGLFLVGLAASGSILLALLPIAVILVVAWRSMKSIGTDYVQLALRTDLRDIRSTYLGATNTCLWVAEASGAVVGLVAAVQPQDPTERGTVLELKRLSVRQAYRGRGIARALSRTVLQFAQEHGYRAVMLETSVVQRAAQQLYERLGFRLVATECPSLLARLLQFYILHYRLDIPAAP
ncbi:N-acetyltransferase 8B isoform C [Alligator mississippiensis]|uniref:N-acetyltransferase 8B isoform C n=1 Tax=Alligator mississippiensis TaxID=8496 RepID=A0A151PHU0_ALLMI|nr:N-acetyltransferase 8B isoform C [Alligator mississippiensis]